MGSPWGRLSGAFPSDILGGQGHCSGIISLQLSRRRAWGWPKTMAMTTSLWMVCQALYLALSPLKGIIILILKMTKTRHREANAPFEVHTADGIGAEPSNVRASHLMLPLPGGQLCWAMEEERRSKCPGELGKALLPRGPYSVWMSQFIPTGCRLDIRDSGLFIPIL